jgi:hypothetical protein
MFSILKGSHLFNTGKALKSNNKRCFQYDKKDEEKIKDFGNYPLIILEL